eukprot:3144469-Rhodomonas_salina.1
MRDVSNRDRAAHSNLKKFRGGGHCMHTIHASLKRIFSQTGSSTRTTTTSGPMTTTSGPTTTTASGPTTTTSEPRIAQYA